MFNCVLRLCNNIIEPCIIIIKCTVHVHADLHNTTLTTFYHIHHYHYGSYWGYGQEFHNVQY
jgi:hypothetical protein